MYAKRKRRGAGDFDLGAQAEALLRPHLRGRSGSGQANVFAATADLSAYAFLVGPRSSSPVVSTLRASPISGLSVNWQADYDALYHRVVDSSLSVDYRWKLYGISAAITKCTRIRY